MSKKQQSQAKRKTPQHVIVDNTVKVIPQNSGFLMESEGRFIGMLGIQNSIDDNSGAPRGGILIQWEVVTKLEDGWYQVRFRGPLGLPRPLGWPEPDVLCFFNAKSLLWFRGIDG